MSMSFSIPNVSQYSQVLNHKPHVYPQVPRYDTFRSLVWSLEQAVAGPTKTAVKVGICWE